ncbi:acyltransferase [Paenibacillus sp. 7124]|uniref:Acyltransferase n=1 Tax=Paenibacillus apii TaxID=1850370 RepID=A0A6M1PUB1_9BACL|nr:acyltransferase [Paenibacillus apii]NGM85303.1 acyltransferase [Paenibacillus apii]
MPQRTLTTLDLQAAPQTDLLPTKKKERIEEITLLRAFAFLAITMQHSIAEYIYRSDILQSDAIMLTMLFDFTRFGTPTFVFLSGLLLFYKNNGKLSYWPFVRKRLVDIYLPFVCWTVIYWIAVQGVAFGQLGNPADWPRTLLHELFLPTYGYHLWFIPMIFQYYLLFPLFVLAIQKVRQKLQAMPGGASFPRVFMIVAAIGALYGILMWLSSNRMPDWATDWGGIWASVLSYRSYYFVFYFFYFLLGAVCAFGLQRWRRFVEDGFIWYGFAFIALYIWQGYEILNHSTETINLNYAGYLRPFTFVLIVSQLLLLYGIIRFVQTRGGAACSIFRFIGTYSFGGFLAHAFVLMLISFITRPLSLTGYHLPAAVLTFALTAAGSIALAKLLSKLSFGRWLVGPTGKQANRNQVNARPAQQTFPQ